jgi:hypothetical protein
VGPYLPCQLLRGISERKKKKRLSYEKVISSIRAGAYSTCYSGNQNTEAGPTRYRLKKVIKVRESRVLRAEPFLESFPWHDRLDRI